MRKPTVKNKYNLTMAKIRKLKIVDRSKVGKPLFWRNDVIGAWCIVGSAGNKMDVVFGTDNEFWIGIYDDNAKTYAGSFVSILLLMAECVAINSINSLEKKTFNVIMTYVFKKSFSAK